MLLRYLAPLTLLLLLGCKTIQTTPLTAAPETETRQLDTMTVSAPPMMEGMEMEETEPEDFALPTYRAAATRTHDLLHTTLRVKFDWETEQVMGVANLRMAPLFYATDQVTLDAKGFKFNSIKLVNGKTDLQYTYESDSAQQVTIMLPREYKKGEEFELVIDYVATPAQSGGSSAISSDKGLFFINPQGEDPDKPRQIWTQGETESNSRWFPTFDKPNERCTQTMYITVEDKYLTLSNGLLKDSKKNSDGTRTDHWEMEIPHAPYLFMIAVGEFAEVKEKWRGIPVNYYVEKEFKDDAKAIFPHTPDLLTFFSDITGVDYPWPKYSQIVVRDYVSGAMENTTAVIFGEFMQQTERELIDNLTNDKIVAHEMFHHWFGDYVTCETWSQLTLNEGFANYSEYLWLEKQFGRDEADSHLLEEWSGYLGSAQRGGVHPLIWTDYDDKEDMFDAHSYNKGGSVLHMLRYYVGDEAFFASLKKYLTDNKLSAVEVDELRMAFEEITGEDLNWFFNQWFHQPGHPALNVTYGYNRENKEATVLVEQTQSTENGTPGVFQLPVDIDIYGPTGGPTRQRVMVTEREQLFRFPAATEPSLIVFDAEHVLLGPKDYNNTAAQLAAQFRRAPRFLDRYNALARISSLDGEDELQEAIFNEALQDTFYGIRAMALQRFEMGENSPALPRVRDLARQDKHSEVRSTALGVLAAAEDPMTAELAKNAIDNARSYAVVGAGLAALAVAAPEEATTYAKKLENEKNGEISAAVATIYSESGDVAYLPYFQSRLEQQDGFGAMNFFGSYQELLATGTPEQFTAGLAELRRIGTDQKQSPWRRLASAKALADMRGELSDEVQMARINEVISEIVAAETNEDLLRIYPQFTGGK